MSTIDEVRDYLATETQTSVRTLAPGDSLLEAGVLDSMAIVKLIAYLEERYGVTLDDDEFDPDNFESLEAIGALVERKRPR